MYPYLSADLAAAHRADLMREAAAHRCSVPVRHPVVDRFRAAVRRATAALSGAIRTAPACCPA